MIWKRPFKISRQNKFSLFPMSWKNEPIFSIYSALNRFVMIIFISPMYSSRKILINHSTNLKYSQHHNTAIESRTQIGYRSVIKQFAQFIMAALRSRCGHYIFALWFLFSSFFLSSPNLSRRRVDVYHSFYTWCGLSANLRCRSEICCRRVAANTGRKNDAKNRHLGIVVQFYQAEFSQRRHVSTIGKKTC